jgi:hypothetical protein
MFVSWDIRRPPKCTEHGPLADVVMPRTEGWAVILDHLRDAHSAFYTTIPEDQLAKMRGATGS